MCQAAQCSWQSATAPALGTSSEWTMTFRRRSFTTTAADIVLTFATLLMVRMPFFETQLDSLCAPGS